MAANQLAFSFPEPKQRGGARARFIAGRNSFCVALHGRGFVE
jgi:hypothetical protein